MLYSHLDLKFEKTMITMIFILVSNLPKSYLIYDFTCFLIDKKTVCFLIAKLFE